MKKFKADPITDHDRLVYKMAYTIGYSEAQAKYQHQLEIVEQKLRKLESKKRSKN